MNRREISDAVSDLGWRLILEALCTSVQVDAMSEAVTAAAQLVDAAEGAAERLRVDLRADRMMLTLQLPTIASVTRADIDLAGRLSDVVRAGGRRTEPGLGHGPSRSLQILEIGIDAMDIASIRPFWKAVTGYADEAGSTGEEDPLVDPLGQGPAIWFQQMDAPRPQRNRIHFDVSVPHDEAVLRIEAALSAGGVLLSDTRAPAFWVLADAEGNEACVTTWQGRDS